MTLHPNLNNEALQWASAFLASHGYTLKNNVPEIVQHTPWSYVVRIVTSTGNIYLKQVPVQLALEVDIICMLHDKFRLSVPEVIASHKKLGCFLMKDSGVSLRSLLKREFDRELLKRAIFQFTTMQLTVTDHIDSLLAIGVPDWRLENLPDLYKALLSQEKMLMTDGLSADELLWLKKHSYKVSELCEALASYHFKPTLVQPDFNDNNTLIDPVTQKITTVDLGEIVISHPIFSWVNCLEQAKKHYAVQEEDQTYMALRAACFENYRICETEKRLLEAFSIAQLLFHIYGALGCDRLMKACDSSQFTSSFQHHGRVSIPLKQFISIVS